MVNLPVKEAAWTIVDLKKIALRVSEEWDAQGALAQYLRALFGQKENFTVYISREKGDRCYIQRRNNDLFFSLQSFSRKT